MKLRYSPIAKVFLHLSLAASGFLILFSSLSISNYLSRYGTASSFTETAEFEERYGKYLERLAFYVLYREEGFLTAAGLYDKTEIPFTDYNYLVEQKDDQSEFDFYDQKLNHEDTSFLYYVKNTVTGTEYFSPSLPAYASSLGKADGLERDAGVQKSISYFLEHIRENPAYFILNTSEMVYSTSVNHCGYITKANVDWLARCINGSLYQNQDASYINLGDSFLVYAAILPGFPGTEDDFAPLYKEYSVLYTKNHVAYVLLPISILLFLTFFLLTIANTGHSSKKKGIVLLRTDRIYTEFYLLLFLLIPLTAVYFVVYFSYTPQLPWFFKALVSPVVKLYSLLVEHYHLTKIFRYFLLYLILYPPLSFLFFGIIRRMKAKKMLSSSLCFHLYAKVKHSLRRFMENKSVTGTAALYFSIICVLLAVSFLFTAGGHPVFGLILLLAGLVFAARYLFHMAADLNVLVEKTKKIADGEELTIPEAELMGPMKRLGGYINHIGDGLSKAVDERLRSERLKTELITNVSHDIKTPLTSIINYVDLLKKENLQNERTAGYLNILSQKTWRLKTLIEDLMDASKASSGSVSLTMEKLNLVELLRQIMGEYEDRFQQNKLEAVLNTRQDPVYIMADGRSTCRIIENLFSNANKYALTGTRIYIDVEAEEGPPAAATVSIKNISAQKLNIPSEELMERFVRGDLARSSEGSGLGLSIAQSLASLQGASFAICLDGDLFKAVLRFPILV